MTNQQSARPLIYRINKFVVPAESRSAFLDLMGGTLAFVRHREGVIDASFFEQESGPAIFNFVTTVVCLGQEASENVIAAVADFDRQSGTDRPRTMAGLGVKADLGVYRSLDI